MIKYYIPENYLEHHGVIGMHWGVRRYQNYDGSYTQAGLKRYYANLERLNNSKEHLKKTKADYKAGKTSKLNVNRAKNIVKKDKYETEKSYKQLALDKKADKGKLRYNTGQRIRANNKGMKVAKVGATVGVLGAAYYAYTFGQPTAQVTGSWNNPYTRRAALAAIGIIGAYSTAKIISDTKNSELSAYYSHKGYERKD
jgi:hypothetical protein